ncbi:MAG: type II toxin-antitoxin system RelE family toxin [Planctomycetota bacterium]
MEVKFRRSFERDLRRIRDETLRQRVWGTITALARARRVGDIPGAARLRGSDRHYKIRVGNYRLGFVLEEDTAVLVRFLHRRDIYRHFP